MSEFDRDREIIEKATPGPWYVLPMNRVTAVRDAKHRCVVKLGHWSDATHLKGDLQEANVALIVAARTHWPFALDRIAAQDLEIERLRKIAAFVPARIYIEASERAGYGTQIHTTGD
jgi:hypothetical protein